MLISDGLGELLQRQCATRLIRDEGNGVDEIVGAEDARIFRMGRYLEIIIVGVVQDELLIGGTRARLRCGELSDQPHPAGDPMGAIEELGECLLCIFSKQV